MFLDEKAWGEPQEPKKEPFPNRLILGVIIPLPIANGSFAMSASFSHLNRRDLADIYSGVGWISLALTIACALVILLRTWR